MEAISWRMDTQTTVLNTTQHRSCGKDDALIQAAAQMNLENLLLREEDGQRLFVRNVQKLESHTERKGAPGGQGLGVGSGEGQGKSFFFTRGTCSITAHSEGCRPL